MTPRTGARQRMGSPTTSTHRATRTCPVGRGAPHWETFSAAKFGMMAIDIVFYRWLVDNSVVQRSDECWKAQLFQPGCVYKNRRSGKMFMVVGCVPPMATMLEVVEVRIAGRKFLKFKLDNMLPTFTSLVDLDGWDGQSFEYTSPLAFWVAIGGSFLDDVSGLFGAPLGELQPMLHFAASHGFFQLEEPSLDRIASRECNLELGGDLGSKLINSVEHVLRYDDAEACDILERRLTALQTAHAYDDMIETEEAVDFDDEAEACILKSYLSSSRAKKAAASVVEEKMNATLAQVKPPNKKRSKTNTQLPERDADYTVDRCLPLFPKSLSVRLTKDTFNGRWLVFWRRQASAQAPWRSLSRSWGSRSHEQCIKELLRNIWAPCVARGEHCPIEGLFE